MPELLDRLRNQGCDREPFTADHAACVCRLANAAADEIDRLRSALENICNSMEGDNGRRSTADASTLRSMAIDALSIKGGVARLHMKASQALRLLEIIEDLPPGEWEVSTSSNGSRRITAVQSHRSGPDGGVLSGTVQRDGHPDLSMSESQLWALCHLRNIVADIVGANLED